VNYSHLNSTQTSFIHSTLLITKETKTPIDSFYSAPAAAVVEGRGVGVVHNIEMERMYETWDVQKRVGVVVEPSKRRSR
jgi:hypothetical protein